MAGAAVLGRLNWTLGEVTELTDETPRVRSIVLDVANWPGHRAGQRVEPRRQARGADWSRAYRAGRVAVESDLTLPGHPQVFEIGDTIRVRDRSGEPVVLPDLAPVAMQQGAVRRGASSVRACEDASTAPSATGTRATWPRSAERRQ